MVVVRVRFWERGVWAWGKRKEGEGEGTSNITMCVIVMTDSTRTVQDLIYLLILLSHMEEQSRAKDLRDRGMTSSCISLHYCNCTRSIH